MPLAVSAASLALAVPASADPPGNDNLAMAEILGPALPAEADGTLVEATVETGEGSNHTSEASIWYQWTAGTTETVALDVCDSGRIPEVGVYTGDAFPLSEVAVDGDDCVFSFEATASQAYKIALYVSGTRGPTHLRISGPPPNDDLADAQVVDPTLPVSEDGSLLNASAEPMENAHGGFPAQYSIWYAWTPSASGPVLVNAECVSGGARVGVYTGTAFPLAPVASSRRGCGVRFTATAGQTYRIALDAGRGPGPTSLELSAPLPNDDFADRQVLTGPLPISVDGDTTGATAEHPDEPTHVLSVSGRRAQTSLWYEWTPAGTGEATIDLCSAGGFGNNGAAVYTGDQLDDLTRIAGSEEDECLVTFDATAGTSYKLAVDNNSRPDDFTLRIDQAVEASDGVTVVQGLTTSIQDPANADSGKKRGKPKKKKRKKRP